MTAFVAAVFFFRFGKRTGDFLFYIFGIAFVIFGIERILILVEVARLPEKHPLVYLVRASGYALILLGIVLKNREQDQKAH